MYPDYPIFPQYRESPPRQLTAAELRDAEHEYDARRQETERILRRYRRHHNADRVRDMVTSLLLLEAERQKFFQAQEQLHPQSMRTVCAA
jgi:hypothetical protein